MLLRSGNHPRGIARREPQRIRPNVRHLHAGDVFSHGLLAKTSVTLRWTTVLGLGMTNPECYRVQRQYDEAMKTRQAAEEDLGNSSPNSSPLAVRRARLQTVKREESVAEEILLDHRRRCSLCKNALST
jgi:hypothetical protein